MTNYLFYSDKSPACSKISRLAAPTVLNAIFMIANLKFINIHDPGVMNLFQDKITEVPTIVLDEKIKTKDGVLKHKVLQREAVFIYLQRYIDHYNQEAADQKPAEQFSPEQQFSAQQPFHQPSGIPAGFEPPTPDAAAIYSAMGKPKQEQTLQPLSMPTTAPDGSPLPTITNTSLIAVSEAEVDKSQFSAGK